MYVYCVGQRRNVSSLALNGSSVGHSLVRRGAGFGVRTQCPAYSCLARLLARCPRVGLAPLYTLLPTEPTAQSCVYSRDHQAYTQGPHVWSFSCSLKGQTEQFGCVCILCLWMGKVYGHTSLSTSALFYLFLQTCWPELTGLFRKYLYLKPYACTFTRVSRQPKHTSELFIGHHEILTSMVRQNKSA